jgi:GT2 family glycosyltransferase
MPRLSVVIVTYQSKDDIDACLGSLAAHPPFTPLEVVVVDNASPDGTADYVRQHWVRQRSVRQHSPAVTVIDAGGNLGFAAANNVGIRHGTAELVLALNPDTIVPAGAIDALVACLDAHPDVAVVGPRIVDAAGQAELSFGSMIAPLAELTQKVLMIGLARHVPDLIDVVEERTSRSQDVDWVSGACLLARRADLEAVGLFDERFFLYTEDVDLCAAIRARGRRVHFLATTQIVHARGRSGATDPAAAQAAYRHSQLAFYRKHHPAWAPLLRAYLKLRGQLPDTP